MDAEDYLPVVPKSVPHFLSQKEVGQGDRCDKVQCIAIYLQNEVVEPG